MKNSTGLILLICFLVSCSDTELDVTKENHLYNVSYGPDFRNTMDVVLPANRNDSTPIVIFIHGGAWIMGDKLLFHTEMEQMSDEGIAAVSINYRFISDIFNLHHPVCPNDVRLAVDFIVSKSEEWSISPDRIGIVGHSAGGHLSLITSYQFNNDHRIKACASWAGPLDFTDPDQRAIVAAPELFRSYMGFGLVTSDDSLQYRLASPYWTVNASSIPTLLIYGTEDIGVPYSNAVKFQNKLNALGVENEKLELTGANHIWLGNDLTRARNKTIQWFKDNL